MSVIQDKHGGSKTMAKCTVGLSIWFKIKVGINQESATTSRIGTQPISHYNNYG